MNSITRERMDEVFRVLKESVEEVMKRHGYTVKPNKGWLNLSTCPWCDHGDENFQCGVKEDPAPGGGYVHAVRCMHPHDSPDGSASPHYADFLAALGEISQQEADEVRRLAKGLHTGNTLRTVNTVKKATPVQRTTATKPQELGLLNDENNAKVRKRLRDNRKALDYLLNVRGFTQATLDEYRMGLSEPYVKDGKPVHADALAAPLRGFDGRFYRKYVNYAIPRVTQDHREKKQKAWSPGPARAYYSGDARKKKWLFVCDGLKDLWALTQVVKGTRLDELVVFASSTNGGGGLPDEWKDPEFWNQWEKVFAGHDNDTPDALTGRRAGDEHALALARLADREVLRVSPPGVKDWNDWMLVKGNTGEDFVSLVAEAEPIQTLDEIKEDDDGATLGRFSANPVQIVGSYHNGYLYEAVRTFVRDVDPATGELVEFFDTVVIRSDRTTHRVRRMPAPKGTHDQNQVWRLTPDGTMLSSLPVPNPSLTWEWDAIKSWLDGKDKAPSLKELLGRIKGHLRASVWLPYEDDYTLLACTITASYVQQVFDAVPLILVTGAPGTGKSELGFAIKSLGANSKNVLGQVTSATIARFIDSTRGLVVIDDLEEIASSRDSAFGDLVQTLKLSYKKATAMKMVTEMKNGQGIQRQFNFFGIKVINNTRGSDAILGSRMLTIHTRRMPSGIRLDTSTLLTPDVLDVMRNHLHTWAFSNVQAVAESYQAIFPNKSGRQEEISAPLRVIASLSGDSLLASSLERALDRQSKTKDNPDTPEDILREALENILRRAIETSGQVQTWVTVMQVMMEMSTLVDSNYGKEFTTSLSSIEKPEWVGRTLRQLYSDPNADQARTNMYGKSLRAYKLTQEFIEKTLERIKADSPDLLRMPLKSTTDFKAFCAGCPTCPYRNRCEMQSEREQREAVKYGGHRE